LDLDLWGEIYQDLSSLCPEPQQDCIVENEQNTPEIGVQPEFNFPTDRNVSDEIQQDEQFDLVSYIIDELEPDTILPASVELISETSGTHPDPAQKATEKECNQMLASFNLLGNQNQQLLEELSLPDETLGQPAKKACPSTPREESSSGSKLRTLSKRSRMSSLKPEYDRYRQ
jgi:hypothetical protein